VATIAEHERIFECPVTFGAEICRLVIARHVWDTPRTGGDPGRGQTPTEYRGQAPIKS
jgi:hypothetical protein